MKITIELNDIDLERGDIRTAVAVLMRADSARAAPAVADVAEEPKQKRTRAPKAEKATEPEAPAISKDDLLQLMKEAAALGTSHREEVIKKLNVYAGAFADLTPEDAQKLYPEVKAYLDTVKADPLA